MVCSQSCMVEPVERIVWFHALFLLLVCFVIYIISIISTNLFAKFEVDGFVSLYFRVSLIWTNLKKNVSNQFVAIDAHFTDVILFLSDLWPNYDFKSLIWFSNNQKKNYTSFHFHNCVWLDVLNENVCIWDHSFSWHGHSTKESNKTRIKNETTSKHLFAIISDSVYIHHICKKFTTFLNRQMKQTFVRPSFANGFLFFSLHRSFKTMIEWFRGFGPACPFNSSYTIK